MSGALAANGGQSDKPVKFTPIYVGRVFTGIWTNRSPLRDAASTRTEEKYYGPRGDAMIAGANVEISNRLTMIRRPGNPIYDNVNTFDNILSFDSFRVSKALSDANGTTLEAIETMVDTALDLFADSSTFVKQNIFTKTTGAGQSFMKQVGNQLYFGNGLDNKKWNQTLFTRTSANNNTLIQTASYPFMDTYIIDPNSGNPQIHQLIGKAAEASGGAAITITNVAITNDILTLTVSAAPTDPTKTKAGTEFLLWGFTNVNTKFLNGFAITLTADWTATTITAGINHADLSQADTAYLQEAGGNPTTGNSVPTWGTVAPSSANNFYGSLNIDGTAIWINRGTPTQNWGLAAPTETPTFSASGAETGWSKNTYYSPGSIYAGNGTTGGTTHGYLWQVSTAGITAATEPAWPATPTPQTKISITKVQVASNVAIFTTETQGLANGDNVLIQDLDVATFLNGQTVTVIATGLTTTQFEANFTHPDYAAAFDLGTAIPKTGSLAPTTQADGAAVWTCIQNPASLTWQSHHHYHEGDFLLNSAGGQQQYFFLRKNTQPFIVPSTLASIGWNTDQNVQKGDFDKAFPQTVGDFTPTTPTSLNWTRSGSGNFQYIGVNGAAETGGSTDSGHGSQTTGGNADPGSVAFATTCQIYIPAPGTYAFSCTHGDGAYFAFDSSTGAYRVSGTGTNIFANTPPKTAVKGYVSPSGNNNSNGNTSQPPEVPFTDSASWYFPAAGAYGFEVDSCRWRHSGGNMLMKCAGQQIAVGPDESGTNQPSWPAYTTTGATYNTVTDLINFPAKVQEAGLQYTWSNIGSVGDFTWIANTFYTLPGTQIVDSNSNLEGAIQTGATATTAPVWNTTINSITADNPNLKWINEGPVPQTASAIGKITATSAQGWIYALALVNTLDNTVSNIGPLSAGTGPVIGGQVTFAPGAGLDITKIDPQADYVAIFRTTDGQSTELLVPANLNTDYTVPLVQYLQYGYVDTTPDVGLDIFIQAAAAGENTPPLPGAVNLTYHLNRIWYSIGNTVFYTTGPLTPAGNGINGTAPGNQDVMPSTVKRLIPTSIGVIVFTVSDIYIIETSGGNIYPGLPYSPGIGISSYNEVDINGPQIGFITTDKQFLVFDPSGGLGVASVAIADQLLLNNGQPGTSWNPATGFVAHYANGQDMAWFIADGVNGWYKLIPTPAPDSGGSSWSPFATIVNGVKAIKSVETSPGVHQLLLSEAGTGKKIRSRSLTATTDGGTTDSNGTSYPAYAVFGSYVLANPGQVAQVAFITTDSVNVGSPLIIGLLLDEALPYYTGSFDMIKKWNTDPPGLPESKSILGQRFYLSQIPDKSAACRHLQFMVQWPAENAANELQSFTIFGNLLQEQ